ncbi:HNH endonuclease [Cronobacter dublinensis]
MLFNYPPHADGSNWLQDFLISLVIEALSSRLNGVSAKKWSKILPVAHKSELSGRSGLRRRYEALVEATKNLSVAEVNQALHQLATQNYFSNVLSGTVKYQIPSGSNDLFKKSLRDLFEFSFGLLDELKIAPQDTLSIRDSLYKKIYRSMPGHYCPFCGIDRFDAPNPNIPRHPLDHYLAISLYPIFGANISNLVSMCGRCNSSFKLASDMLVDNSGLPRACIDPYGQQTAKISLMNSIPFGGGEKGQLPQWTIDFIPAIQEFETWDDVFSIRLRYKESILNAEYKAWLGEFSRWAIDGHIVINNNHDASVALLRWASICSDLNEQGFLKKPMFEMLSESVKQQDENGKRVTNLVKTLCSI